MAKAEVGPELFQSWTLAARLPELQHHLSAPVERISTGWPLLDRALTEPGMTKGGFVRPSVVAVGAPPKQGKSLWAQCIVQNWVASGGWCLYWDLENGAKRFVRRLGWRIARLASEEIQRGLSREEKKRHEYMLRWMERKGQRLAYTDDRHVGPADMDVWLSSATCVSQDDPLLMVVDSLQKVPAIEKMDRRGYIDTWMRAFEAARDRYNCIIIVVSEMGRAKGGGHKKGQTGYKESGDIEYTADLGLEFSEVFKGSLSAYLDVTLDRDATRESQRVGRYTRVPPYYQVIEEPAKKQQQKED